MNELIKAAVIGGGIWMFGEYCFALGKGCGLKIMKLENPDYWPEFKKAALEAFKDKPALKRAFINLAIKTADSDMD